MSRRKYGKLESDHDHDHEEDAAAGAGAHHGAAGGVGYGKMVEEAEVKEAPAAAGATTDAPAGGAGHAVTSEEEKVEEGVPIDPEIAAAVKARREAVCDMVLASYNEYVGVLTSAVETWHDVSDMRPGDVQNHHLSPVVEAIIQGEQLLVLCDDAGITNSEVTAMREAVGLLRSDVREFLDEWKSSKHQMKEIKETMKGGCGMPSPLTRHDLSANVKTLQTAMQTLIKRNVEIAPGFVVPDPVMDAINALRRETQHDKPKNAFKKTGRGFLTVITRGKGDTRSTTVMAEALTADGNVQADKTGKSRLDGTSGAYKALFDAIDAWKEQGTFPKYCAHDFTAVLQKMALDHARVQVIGETDTSVEALAPLLAATTVGVSGSQLARVFSGAASPVAGGAGGPTHGHEADGSYRRGR